MDGVGDAGTLERMCNRCSAQTAQLTVDQKSIRRPRVEVHNQFLGPGWWIIAVINIPGNDQQIYFFVLDYLNKVRQKASLLIHPAVTFNIFA